MNQDYLQLKNGSRYQINPQPSLGHIGIKCSKEQYEGIVSEMTPENTGILKFYSDDQEYAIYRGYTLRSHTWSEALMTVWISFTGAGQQGTSYTESQIAEIVARAEREKAAAQQAAKDAQSQLESMKKEADQLKDAAAAARILLGEE